MLAAAEARSDAARACDDGALRALLGAGASLEHYGEGKLVRVVAVGGAANTCPCGGTHVDRAARLRGVVVSKVKSAKGATKVSYTVA